MPLRYGNIGDVTERLVARSLPVAIVMTWAVLGASTPSASAEPCPDVEAVFARGTSEPPGVGGIGEAFTDSLRSKIGRKSLGVYPVDYPASTDFHTALDGIRDASNHVESMATNCPKTRMVLGGYSQGAAVMGFVTSAAIPDGIDAADVPQPMPPNVADHVAAVTLFGTPSNQFMNTVGAPPIVIGPLYQPKTIELCATADPVCSNGGDWAAHNSYADDGMVEQGANFAASHL
jgi:cutinase